MLNHASAPVSESRPETAPRRRVRRSVGAFVREATCGMSGHEYLLERSGNRLFLRRVDCGHETSGWRIDVRRAH